MTSKGSSDFVRSVAELEYVKPANKTGGKVRIRVGDMEEVLLKKGFPSSHINQICSALESKKFWEPRGMKMLTPRGQARRIDTVFEYQVGSNIVGNANKKSDPLLSLFGRFPNAFPEGADAFIRDIRKDKDVGK